MCGGGVGAGGGVKNAIDLNRNEADSVLLCLVWHATYNIPGV